MRIRHVVGSACDATETVAAAAAAVSGRCIIAASLLWRCGLYRAMFVFFINGQSLTSADNDQRRRTSATATVAPLAT